MTIVKSNALNKALFLSFVMMYHALGRQGVFAIKNAKEPLSDF